RVKGHVGRIQVFSNSTELHLEPKHLSTFIQTDKLNYLPGQEVNIRAVSIHPDGKPYISPVDIIIRDPRGNLLRQWLSVESVLGVVTRKFQLSENPPLGQWNIVTTVSVSLTYNSTAKVSLARQKYKLTFDGYPKILRPSLNFVARVRKVTFFYRYTQIDSKRMPGDMATLKVAVAEPGSLVGILVVDKATQLKGSHNDITKERVRTTAIYYLSGTDGPLMQQQQEPRERSNFPETWIWMDTNTGDSDTAELTLPVPDSITTWTATAFVMSENLGLGVVESPAELTVFQDFFLSLNLPAYIIRGEELLLEIILFNYLPHNLEVMVIVAESDTFEFIFPDNEVLSMPSVRHLSVGSNSGKSVLIPIKPLVLGEIPISVKAMSSAASDLVRRMVLVKAEGLEQSFSTSLLFEVSPSQPSLSKHITFTFPADVVEGSKRASVTAVGDILGPSISGLDSLIQMPHGCGEQNMINFAPNIYVLQYLSATGQADQEVTDRATDYMTKGYERELSYQRADGSFSAFGDQDQSGSTWLTAFVLKCFLQARPYISIEAQVLHRAVTWLVSQQGDDGRFVEPGRVIHTELQGGLDGPVSLTAYVLIYGSQVSEALMFLETRLALSVPSNYSLSVLLYALALSGSSNTNTALSELTGRAEMRDGVPMWSSPDAGLSSSWQPRSADIEMASYLLLALHKLGHIEGGLSLMKWLSQQRNDRGGFGSTQDTVVALQALSTFAALGRSQDFDVTISVNTDASTKVASFHIHQNNYLLLQKQELNLQVTAEGRGLALFQLNVFYNVRHRELMRRRDAGKHNAFYLHVDDVQQLSNVFMLSCCLHSLSESLGLTATGMAILDVGLLSGFSLAPEGFPTDEVVKKVEAEPGKVIMYLDSVRELCLTIPLVMEYKVTKVQEATVSIYDYYEPRRRTVRTYTSEWRSEMSTCSFCGDDCSDCQADDYYELSSASRSSRNVLSISLLPALLLIFSL
uniref:CD109 molecule n=1 Tax=Lates calcarifer TaxID=8187 RepID=A0A4W6FTI1_LATCA